MSPSLNSRLSITISPDRIILQKLSRGFNPKLIAQHDEPVDTSWKSSSSSSGQEVIDRLNRILEQPEWQNGVVDVVLSNRLVRYAVITFGEQLKKYSEQEAFARHALHKIYGAMAGQFELRIQQSKAGEPSLISAVDVKLLDHLRQLCITHKLKLRSIIPHLTQVFNQYRKDFKVDPAWLIMKEANYCLFALLQNGVVTSVSGMSLDNINELPIQLDRENLTSSALPLPCKTAYLYVCPGYEIPAITQGEYKIIRLDSAVQDGFSEFRDRLFALYDWTRRKLKLDYQQPIDHPIKRAGWLLLATSLVLLLDMGMTYDHLHNDRVEMDHKITSSKIRLDKGSRTSVSGQFTDKDFEEARKIIGRLSIPWNMLFAALESVENKNVIVLSIDPDVQTGLLHLKGEAKDYASVLTLVAQLRTTEPFVNVYLTNHDVKQEDPQHPVSFALSLRWRNPS